MNGRGGAAIAAGLVVMLLTATAPAAAQSAGAVAGRITDSASGLPVKGALVTLDEGRRGGVTDSAGLYRIREVRAGVYTLHVRALGYAPVRRDSLLVQAAGTSIANVVLRPRTVELAPIIVESADRVL
ncbi:MAG TPA: carboxypeptidase-like regulatory domain-containing protein, partial [Gemmatimonadales bacterium]|nr:carboxypeptidase-like regulatory domain-containing protein [Gemmatimonadales bacterium]